MSNTVTDNMASQELMNFNCPVSVVFITQGQDWQTRQQINYAAQKGLLKEDFLGLNDWSEQIRTYSQTNAMYLMPAYSVILPLVARNRNVLMTLARNPQLGWVGQFLMKVYGFAKVFVAPTELLNDSTNLNARLGL
jgi:hypothetical protein